MLVYACFWRRTFTLTAISCLQIDNTHIMRCATSLSWKPISEVAVLFACFPCLLSPMAHTNIASSCDMDDSSGGKVGAKTVKCLESRLLRGWT